MERRSEPEHETVLRPKATTSVALRAALRRWHDPHLSETALADGWQLVKAEIASGDRADSALARGQALRTILSRALGSMRELGFTDEAELLSRQYVKGDSIYAIASDLAVGERAYFKRQRRAIEALAGVLDAMEADTARKSERDDGETSVQPSRSPGPAGQDSPVARSGPYQTELSPPFQAPPVPGWWVGRPEESAWLMRQLRVDPSGTGPVAATTRSVGIVGMAGTGKSALAARAARRVRKRFPDGVIWVEADSVEVDAALIFVAQALRRDSLVARTGPGATREAMVRDLVNRRALLIVIDGAKSDAVISALQPSAGRSRLLVTTRRADLPAMFGAPMLTLGGFRPEESLRLLRRAAGAERVDGAVAAARALASVCEHLPLAVAVAGRLASSHAHRSLEEIGVRLAEAPLDRLLLADRRVVRAAIEAAWDALDPPLGAFLTAIGNFADRITSDTAALLGSGPGDAWEADEWLEALVDRSLLQRGRGEAYRLHGLVRALAAERSPDDSSRRNLCAGYALRLIEVCSWLETARWPEALAWLDAERRNLDALFDWAVERPYVPEAASLIVACGGHCSPYFERRPDPAARRRWSEAGLAVALDIEDDAAIAACNMQLGVAAYREGNLEEAEAHLISAREHYSSLADPLLGAQAGLCLAAIRLARGHNEAAIALSAEAATTAYNLGAHALGARAGNLQGLALARHGRESDAVEALERAIASARASGDDFAEGFAHSNLAEICARTGRLPAGIEHARRALEIAEAVDTPLRVLRCLDTLGGISLAAEDGPAAEAAYRKMRSVLGTMTVRPPIECLALEIGLGRTAMIAGRWRAAASRLRRARSIAVSSSSDFGLAEALRYTAALRLNRPAPSPEGAMKAAVRSYIICDALGRAVGRERAWRPIVEAAGGEVEALAVLEKERGR